MIAGGWAAEGTCPHVRLAHLAPVVDFKRRFFTIVAAGETPAGQPPGRRRYNRRS
jgi:hypothetical protein